MLGVWGDFDTADMKATIEKFFADWTVQQPPVAEFPKVKNAPSPGFFLAEKKDAQQTFFTVGHLGGLRSDKDCAALEILAGILGGGSQSRIAERLRTKLGIPNDITATWDAGYAHAGPVRNLRQHQEHLHRRRYQGDRGRDRPHTRRAKSRRRNGGMPAMRRSTTWSSPTIAARNCSRAR